jgi:hypothetical protein
MNTLAKGAPLARPRQRKASSRFQGHLNKLCKAYLQCRNTCFDLKRGDEGSWRPAACLSTQKDSRPRPSTLEPGVQVLFSCACVFVAWFFVACPRKTRISVVRKLQGVARERLVSSASLQLCEHLFILIILMTLY